VLLGVFPWHFGDGDVPSPKPRQGPNRLQYVAGAHFIGIPGDPVRMSVDPVVGR